MQPLTLGARRGIFISGTDTGIGKSIVSAALARLLRLKGVSVGVMKPVTSGCEERDGALVSLDAELLCWGAGVPFEAECAPYLAKAPLAPSAAAALEGLSIDPDAILSAYRRLAGRHDFVIVEGAGGLMVPLSGSFLIADLVKALELPLLVVARPNLGTVNHTLLTTFCAAALGLNVSGVVINRYPAVPGLAEESAPPLLRELCPFPLLGLFPEAAGASDREVVEHLVAQLGELPETDELLHALLR